MRITSRLHFSIAYLIWLAVVLPVTLFFMRPDILMVTAMITFGLGLVLMFLPTLLAYGLCFFPIAFSWDGNRKVFAPAAAVFVLTFTLLPHFLAKQELPLLISYTTPNLAAVQPVAAHTILIEQRARYEGTFEMPGNSCGGPCNHLLKTGQLDWVQVDTYSGQRLESSARYVAGRGGECASPGMATAADSTCIYPAANKSGQADITLRIEKSELPEIRKINAAATLAAVTRQLTVTARDRNGVLLYQQSEPTVSIPMIPALLVISSLEFKSDGALQFMGSSTRFNALSFERVFRDLGYSIDEASAQKETESAIPAWQDGLTPEINRQLLAVLDSPETDDFSDAQKQIIDNWTAYARAHKQWNPDLLKLASRIVGDRRLKAPTFFLDQVFGNSRETAIAMLPAVLDRMEGDPEGIALQVYLQIVTNKLATTDPDILAPYAERIIRLATRDDKVHEWIIPALGRLGVDPLPLLLPFGAPSAINKPEFRAEAACHAELRWSGVLVPELKKALEAAGPFDANSHYQRALRSALIAHGELTYVLGMIPDDRLQRAARRQDENLKKWKRPDCRS